MYLLVHSTTPELIYQLIYQLTELSTCGIVPLRTGISGDSLSALSFNLLSSLSAGCITNIAYYNLLSIFSASESCAFPFEFQYVPNLLPACNAHVADRSSQKPLHVICFPSQGPA